MGTAQEVRGVLAEIVQDYVPGRGVGIGGLREDLRRGVGRGGGMRNEGG